MRKATGTESRATSPAMSMAVSASSGGKPVTSASSVRIRNTASAEVAMSTGVSASR